jgi:DNA invertase Pin-like site-specific DNA recombinase
VTAPALPGCHTQARSLDELMERTREAIELCLDVEGDTGSGLENALRATLAEGEVGHLHVGFKGTMNALYLKDLADKTRRGLRGRIEAGKSGGGLCYGYRVVRSMQGGELATGERDVEPSEAEIVVRIFREFSSGASLRRRLRSA